MFFFKRKNKRIPIVFSDDYLKVPLGLEENNTIYWDMNSYRNFYVIGDYYGAMGSRALIWTCIPR